MSYAFVRMVRSLVYAFKVPGARWIIAGLLTAAWLATVVL